MTITAESRRRVLAVGMFAVIVAALVVYVAAGRGLEGHPGLSYDGARVEPSEVFGAFATAALALVLCWLRPANPIGWLLGAAGLALALSDAGSNYGTRALLMPEEGLPLGALSLSLTAPLWVPALFIPVTVLLVRYPTGRIEGRWARRFDRAAVVGFGLFYVGYATSEAAVTDEVASAQPPLVLPEVVGGALAIGGGVLLLGSAVLILVDAVRRALRADPRERAALLLLMVTAVLAAALIFAGPSELVGSLAFGSTLVAVAIGVLRYQALGIEVVARRALLYAILTALVLVAFVGVTTLLAQLVPAGPTPQVVAAVLIAVGLAPARDRIQRLVDRLLYGERDDPAAALKRLGSSMNTAPSDALLVAVLANLTEGLRLDGARIIDTDGGIVAEWGAPGRPSSLPLTFAGNPLGTLEVGIRRGETVLGRADRQLLETVVPLIAALVHAQGLADDLRAESERVVEATQVERRRLRQELHDGLGPSLTGIGLGLEALSRTVSAADADLLGRLREEVAASLEEIRRIIDDLRPAVLEGAGLLTALRRRVEAVGASGLQVELDLPRSLPTLPPEVERAAYRIADEAITNVVRHAGASRCTISLTVGDELRLVVADDGVGFQEASAPRTSGGVGLVSMRERTERLGGRLEVVRQQPGTALTATLPLRLPTPAPASSIGAAT